MTNSWELSAFIKLARVGAVCFLPTSDGQFLMQKNPKGEAYAGKVRPPGGGKEKVDKDLHATIVRELHEEFGLSPAKIKAKLKFIGYEYRKPFFGSAVFELKGHGLKPGVYQASNDPNEKVELIKADLDHPEYTGPQPHKLLSEGALAKAKAVKKTQPKKGVSAMTEDPEEQPLNQFIEAVYHGAKQATAGAADTGTGSGKVAEITKPEPSSITGIDWGKRLKSLHARRDQTEAPKEEKAASPKLGCLMAMLPSLESDIPNWAADNISADTLAGDGVETETHCTVLYGFNLDFDAKSLDPIVRKLGSFDLKLGKLTRFECPDYDVLKFTAECPELVAFNQKLHKEFAKGITPPTYKYNPHVTVAYVKKGTNKGLDASKLEGRVVHVTQLLFSFPGKKGRVVFDLEGQEKSARFVTESELQALGSDDVAEYQKHLVAAAATLVKKHDGAARVKGSCGHMVLNVKCSDKMPIETLTCPCSECWDDARRKKVKHIRDAAYAATPDGHGIVKGSCGHVIKQCRCAKKHEPVTIKEPCEKCFLSAKHASFHDKKIDPSASQDTGFQKAAAVEAPELVAPAPETPVTPAAAPTPYLPPTTGPAAIAHALGQLDLDHEEKEAMRVVQRGQKTKRPLAVRKLGIIQGFKRSGLTPKDLVISRVPVLPPQFRPYSVAGDTFIPGDANELYRDLINMVGVHKDLEEKLGPEGAAANKLKIYDAARAVYGFGDPTSPKTLARGVTGFLKKITGVNPKFGALQRTLLSKNQDYVGRGVIGVDPDLGLDEIGIPESMAWKLYAPYIQRRLVRNGVPQTDAVRAIKDQTEAARKAMEAEAKERPVMYSRSPAWHRHSVVGGYPKFIKGNALMINPFTTTGLGADMDGDTINVHLPSMHAAVEDTKNKLMPSKMLWSTKNRDSVVPVPKHEQIWGLVSAQQRPAKAKHVFPDTESALKAIQRGDVSMSDEVEIVPNV